MTKRAAHPDAARSRFEAVLTTKQGGALNQAKAAAGNPAQALTLRAPLAQEAGDKGLAAALFRADLQRRQNDFNGAEQTYRAILSRDAQNKDAKLGLYYTLRQANKTRDAQALLQTLPGNVWVRLDMARILQQQGDSARTQGLMAAISQRGAPADNLYAAALFASET